MKIIGIGGRQLLIKKDCFGCTALHHACEYKASTEVIMKIIDLGQRQLILEKSDDGYTSLHIACIFQGSTEIILKMIELGGRQLVMEKSIWVNCIAYCLLKKSVNFCYYKDDRIRRGAACHGKKSQWVHCITYCMSV